MPKKFDGGADRFDKRLEEEKRYEKTLPGEDEVRLPEPVETIHSEAQVRRNDPCPCGSGKKYKKCCGKNQ